jgi:hypothetical protein
MSGLLNLYLSLLFYYSSFLLIKHQVFLSNKYLRSFTVAFLHSKKPAGI